MIRQNLSRLLLKWSGWQLTVGVKIPAKCVIVVAPHTSNWDFVYGQMVASVLELKAKFLMKKEWFFFPFGVVFRAMGGIPVNRSKKTSMVEAMAHEFASRKLLRIAISPEATREPVKEWKKGFYYIAKGAGVPVVLASIDYADKLINISRILIPSGDLEKDFDIIRNYYKGCRGKVAANFAEPA